MCVFVCVLCCVLLTDVYNNLKTFDNFGKAGSQSSLKIEHDRVGTKGTEY